MNPTHHSQSSNSPVAMEPMASIAEGDEGHGGSAGKGAAVRSPVPPQSPHQRMVQEELQGYRQTLEEFRAALPSFLRKEEEEKEAEKAAAEAAKLAAKEAEEDEEA